MTRFPGPLVLLLVAACAAAPPIARAADAASGDGATIDTAIAALYASVSHKPEDPPDFDRLRELLLHGGIFVPPRRQGQDLAVVDVDGFADRYRKAIAARKEAGQPTGFSEREISRRADCFGNVCQVFSTYESRTAPADPRPFQRGINSIQLVRDGARWWIASVAWDVEREGLPIPTSYLPAGGK